MDSREFIKLCEKELLERGFTSNIDNIKFVWLSKTIQNAKAMVYVMHAKENCNYIEITYHGEKQELYIDCYEKRRHIVVEVE